MPKYRVTKSAGVDFPEGFEFETDNLHPVMLQHVQIVGESKAKAAPKAAEDEDKPLTEAALNKLHEAAIKEDAKRFPVTPKVAESKDGPGENS